MMNKILNLFKIIKNIKIFAWFFYNYLCRNVEREKNSYIIPYKGAVIDIDRNAKLILRGKNLEIGTGRIGNSKAETYIRLMDNAIWNCNNGAQICFNATVDVHSNAKFDTGYFFMNSGSCIVADYCIEIGEGTLIGRDNTIYDSDFHLIYDSMGNIKNSPKKVTIGEHCWLTNHVMIQKGVTVGQGTVIAAHTVVRTDVEENSMFVNGTNPMRVGEVKWDTRKARDGIEAKRS